MKKQILNFTYFILIILLFSSCSQKEKSKDNLTQKTKNKISEVYRDIQKEGRERIFEYSTTVQSSKIEDIYGNDIGFEIKNQEGKRIEYIANFQQSFFKYIAKKEELFKFLDELKTTHPEISDKKFSISDARIIDEKLKFINSKTPNIYKELQFFTEFYQKEELQYFKINKYPYSNIIICDKNNDTIYHFVENYQY